MLKVEIANGDVLVTGPDRLVSYDRIMQGETSEGIRFVRDTNIDGIYTYGLEQTKDNWEHKAGYIWSSRATAVNKTFGTKLVQIYYREERGTFRPCGMSMFELNKLLEGSDYVVYDEPVESKHDVTYRVQVRRS